MEETKPCRGVIFDFDGTLADSLPGIYEGWKKTFQLLGLGVPEYSFIKKAIGPTREEYLKIILGTESKAVQEKALDIFRKIYREETIFSTKLYGGITEMLDKLMHRGIKLAIASNKPHKQILTLVEILFKKEMQFTSILGPECVVSGKPAPDMFLQCAKDFGYDSDEVIIVGDTPLDMEAGRRAGMRRVAVRWGYGNDTELDDAKPDYNAYMPNDVVAFVDS